MVALFVYGTLRSPNPPGGPDAVTAEDTGNHQFIADEIVLSRPAVLPGAEMLSFVQYPGIKRGSGRVVGELLELTETGLDICDDIEGHPAFFERTMVEVEVVAEGPDQSGAKELRSAWTYWAPADKLAEGTPIASGDWFDRDRKDDDHRSLQEVLDVERARSRDQA